MSHDNDIELIIVDDDELDVELVLRSIKKHVIIGKVFIAKDGVEALDFIFSRDKPTWQLMRKLKLILLDLKLPKVGGIEVLRRVKSDRQAQLIPVVVLSSSAEAKDMLECYNLGVNSYIVKPVDSNEFKTVVSSTVLYWLSLNALPKIVGQRLG